MTEPTKKAPAKKRATPRKPTAQKARTLEVERMDGRKFRITIPAAAKVTMAGGLNPQHRGYGEPAPCLRIYEGTKQTGCFVGIREFRDLDYDFVHEVVEVEHTGDSDSEGNSAHRRDVNRRWVNPPVLIVEPAEPYGF